VPDRVFVAPGNVVWWIEFKRRGEKPTMKQAVEIAKLKMQGANVFVCDSVEEGKGIVDQMILKGRKEEPPIEHSKNCEIGNNYLDCPACMAVRDAFLNRRALRTPLA